MPQCQCLWYTQRYQYTLQPAIRSLVDQLQKNSLPPKSFKKRAFQSPGQRIPKESSLPTNGDRVVVVAVMATDMSSCDFPALHLTFPLRYLGTVPVLITPIAMPANVNAILFQA